jgi:hypothetical protein
VLDLIKGRTGRAGSSDAATEHALNAQDRERPGCGRVLEDCLWAMLQATAERGS